MIDCLKEGRDRAEEQSKADKIQSLKVRIRETQERLDGYYIELDKLENPEDWEDEATDSVQRMCPCDCGLTFSEAVKELVDNGDSLMAAVKFMEGMEREKTT